MGKAALCAWLAVMTCGPLAYAQKEPTPPGGPPPAGGPPAAEPPAEAPAAEPPKEGQGAPTPSEAATPPLVPQEIYSVPRRPALKRRRLELMPTYNVTMNNPLVIHHGFGAVANLFLSEALFLGLEGTYYYRQPISASDRYFLVGADQRVIPSVNQYNWSAFLDFGYIFATGKYAFFNRAVGHWDTYISGGVGIFNTQIIPRNDPSSPDNFSSYLFSALLPGIGAKMWFNRWLSLELYVKNYIFADNLEPAQRKPGDCTSDHDCSYSGTHTVTVNGMQTPVTSAKSNAVSQFTFDVVFGIGLSFFVPPNFEYKTAR